MALNAFTLMTLNAVLFFFTLQDDLSRHMDTLLQMEKDTEITLNSLCTNCLCIGTFSHHTHTHKHEHTNSKHRIMGTLKHFFGHTHTNTTSGTCHGHAAINAISDTD